MQESTMKLHFLYLNFAIKYNTMGECTLFVKCQVYKTISKKLSLIDYQISWIRYAIFLTNNVYPYSATLLFL